MYKFCAETLALTKGYEEAVLSENNVALKAKPNVKSLALPDMPKGRGKEEPNPHHCRKVGMCGSNTLWLRNI